MSSVSDIKLIRTDTTLDLSQKAEKRWRTSSRDEGWFLFPSLEIWWPENCRITSFCCTAGPVRELYTGFRYCTSTTNREETQHTAELRANWQY